MKKETKQKKLAMEAALMIVISKPEDFKYLTVGWIARKLGVSVPNLSRAFKREIGKTLQKYLFQQRIIKSIILLLENPNLSIKELAEIIDYSSSSYFIKVFKKFCNYSPKKFRDS
ncbi:MAG: helix-turn-helix transcriptional regulator [Candidatus Aminicenantes bacterium]|nr:MAG: helix-turn-helix transcriptional regulator [Candidatus Aminicenantes bacterium]